MNNRLFNCTEVAAYYLWDSTGCESALALWHCTEEIGCYLERLDLCSAEEVAAVCQRGLNDPAYVELVRHMAYMVFRYTRHSEPNANWYAVERLLRVREWLNAVTELARVYREEKERQHLPEDVQCEQVRNYYDRCRQTAKP